MLDDDGQPWFLAKEIAEILGYGNSRQAVVTHCKHSKKMTVQKQDGQRGGAQFKTIIPESDLYCIIIKSKMPAAEEFRAWVTEEVLPSVRKTGANILGVKPSDYLPRAEVEATWHNAQAEATESDAKKKMSNLVKNIFRFKGHNLTAIVDADGQPWFVAKEVCDILGYTNSRKAVSDHCKHSKKDGVTKRDAIGREQTYTIIPESDLYRLIIKSKMPAAEEFEAWVTEEVLPSIRKTGANILGVKPSDYLPQTKAEATGPNAQAEATESDAKKKMSNLVKNIFRFKGHDLTAILDEDGQPWFVAKEVCGILGIANPSDAVAKGLDEDEKGVDTIYTLGGAQEVTIINESGLYSLIIRSRKPEAKEFKRWITHEVLPSIRKTGGYGQAESKLRPSDAIGEAEKVFTACLSMAEKFGLKGNQALIPANRYTREVTGLSPMEVLGITHLDSPTQERHCTPSDLGKPLGLSGIKVNQQLEKLGFQERTRDHKNRLVWRPTEKGSQYAVLKDTGKKKGNGTPVQQLFWLESVAEFLEP